MDNKKTIELLETNDSCYLKSLLEQISDNSETLIALAKKGSDRETNSIVAHESKRLAQRHIQLLGIAIDLIDAAEEKKQKVITDLYTGDAQ